MSEPPFAIYGEARLALQSSLVQVRMAHATIREIANNLFREIGYEAKRQELTREDDLQLPWGYRVENISNRYAAPSCRKLNDLEQSEELITFARDIELGWLDRIQAYFDAKTKKERGQIQRETRPWEFDGNYEPVTPVDDRPHS